MFVQLFLRLNTCFSGLEKRLLPESNDPPRFETERAMSSFVRQLKYAVRQLLKSPGFTVVAVLTLALGIGANTAVFTLANAFLIRSFPYPQPERLGVLLNRYTGVP